MGKINLYQSDQLNPVEIQTALNPNADNSIYLLSNERGKLSFYVYSKKRRNFNSQVYGVTGAIPSSNTLIISNSDPNVSQHKLPNPQIEGFQGGQLNNEENTLFNTLVPWYEGARNSDSIEFYVNGVMKTSYPLVSTDKLGKLKYNCLIIFSL
ncbi:hypothetical protein LH67_18975 [Xenorhabdus nematophila]|nr:hypothetical protein LH67_18975 [Xenorhabdus nematophila]